MRNNSLKLAMISPKLKVADVSFNVDEILRTYESAANDGADITVFPELTVTGATCGDLFLQKQLYKSNIMNIKRIIKATEDFDSTIIFGSYLEVENIYLDCIFMAESGILKGIIPKMRAVNFGGINFGRWFGDGIDMVHIQTIENELSDLPVAFGDNIIFDNAKHGIDLIIKNGSDIFFNDTEIEDTQIEKRATPLLVLNVTADSTQTGLINHRSNYYKNKSNEQNCIYTYISPGVYESTTDIVFSGQSFVFGYGEKLAQSKCFGRESTITYANINPDEIKGRAPTEVTAFSYEEFKAGLLEDESNPLPFIPQNKSKLEEFCSDAFTLQANALANRLEHTRSAKALIGVSGGLDSTLAFLVMIEAFNILGKDIKDIITITMPGFGTSDITFDNAISLMKLLGTDLREISIVDSVKQHFKDIGHDINDKNKAYENAQARERTQILMDIANDEDGIVMGTGDLSESALGWSTYGGDHLSMYSVNDSIPKTFIPYVLDWIAENRNNYTDNGEKLKRTLKSIIETPISPELLPADQKGEIAQKTEDSIGPYELHDYFIYHTILNKLTPTEILDHGEKAFAKIYNRDTIKKWLKIFYSRFFSQQFKRNCSAESPMITHISLSPRGGFTMPSDAVANEWLRCLD